MAKERFEYERNRFNLSERLVVELFLFSYLFTFFLGEPGSVIPYIWLLLSIIGGIFAYLLFYSREYSLGPSIGLALSLTIPLFLFGAPLMTIVMCFVYTFWRIQVNYNGSRIHGWPFITVANTAVFISMLLFVRLFYVNDHPEELLQQQMILYLLTSFLFYFIRLVTITINSRQLANFKVREAGKVFSIIIGLGASVFFVVLTVQKPVSLLINETLGFIFGGLSMLFGKAIDPLLKLIELNTEELSEEQTEESGSRLFNFEERAATSSIFEYLALVVVITVLLTITIVLIVRKKKKRYNDRQEPYFHSDKGKRIQENEQPKLLYDYSTARDEIRKSFERFEKEAQRYQLSRSHEETAQEWFLRRGWGDNENVLPIYHAVRYGAHTPSESEWNGFINGLEAIKKSSFIDKSRKF